MPSKMFWYVPEECFFFALLKKNERKGENVWPNDSYK